MYPAAVCPATPAGSGEKNTPPKWVETTLLRLGAVRRFSERARRQRDTPTSHVEVPSQRQAGAGAQEPAVSSPLPLEGASESRS